MAGAGKVAAAKQDSVSALSFADQEIRDALMIPAERYRRRDGHSSMHGWSLVFNSAKGAIVAPSGRRGIIHSGPANRLHFGAANDGCGSRAAVKSANSRGIAEYPLVTPR